MPTPLNFFTVEIRNVDEFPMDMLRRDDADAASREDQELIDILNDPDRRDTLPAKVRVRLASTSRFAPTTARWESFGAYVVEAEFPDRVSRTPSNDPDVLRRQLIAKLGQQAMTLRHLANYAEPAYDACRRAVEVASQDMPFREPAIYYAMGVHEVLKRTDAGAVNTALAEAVDLTRELLITQGLKGLDEMRDRVDQQVATMRAARRNIQESEA